MKVGEVNYLAYDCLVLGGKRKLSWVAMCINGLFISPFYHQTLEGHFFFPHPF
jgi:hypothetical protein